jgi:hypothetical protein
MREQYGNPPADARAKAVYDGLLEVMDPARRTVRLQKEQAAAARAVAADRRKAKFGSPGGVERRKAHRRSGERRARR